MPAYGKNLIPAETTALVAFLETLRPGHMPPARDAVGTGGARGRDAFAARPRRRATAAADPSRSRRRLLLVPEAALAALVLAALVYLRGWRRLSPAATRRRFRPWRLAALLAGLASALDRGGLAPRRLLEPAADGAHGAAPHADGRRAAAASCSGAPIVPMLRGLPRSARPRRARSVPRLAGAATRLGHALTHPVDRASRDGRWPCGAGTCPAPYELALRSPIWHEVEHATFLRRIARSSGGPSSAVAEPRRTGRRGRCLCTCSLGDLQNTVLAAILAFSERVLYPTYALGAAPLRPVGARRPGRSPASLMWVPGSLAFLRARDRGRRGGCSRRQPRDASYVYRAARPHRRSVPPGAPASICCALPVVGALLRARFGRRALQAALFALAAARRRGRDSRGRRPGDEPRRRPALDLGTGDSR